MEATHIKDIDENLRVIRLRFGEKSKPFFRNREFIVYERRETMADGTVVVAVASLPKEIAEGLEPIKKKKNNSIRGFLVESGWVLEKLEDTSCMITYVAQVLLKFNISNFLFSFSLCIFININFIFFFLQLDPAGWLPKCFVNRLNTKLVMIIDNLRKFAQTSPRTLSPP